MLKGKADRQSAAQRDRAPARSGDGAISIIGPGMRIVGDLITDGTVRIEGRVEGTVRAGKAVVVGKEGEVIGDISTQDAVIGGHVKGTVQAESRLELEATSVIEGEVQAPDHHFRLDEGARFNGTIQMGGHSGAKQKPALPSPAPEEAAAQPS